MIQIKTLVLENNVFFWTGFQEFLDKIDPKYQVFNPEVSGNWEQNDTFEHLLMELTQSSLQHVCMQSAFETKAFVEKNGKILTQFEILLPIVRTALRFRERKEMSGLVFHVCYNGTDFIKDLNRGYLGKSAADELSLIMRQQRNIIIKLYDDKHQLLKTLRNKSKKT